MLSLYTVSVDCAVHKLLSHKYHCASVNDSESGNVHLHYMQLQLSGVGDEEPKWGLH